MLQAVLEGCESAVRYVQWHAGVNAAACLKNHDNSDIFLKTKKPLGFLLDQSKIVSIL